MFLKARQQGSALVIAIFIIVVMSIVTAATINIIGSASRGVVTEVYGARALQAARSGLNIALTELLPLDQEVQTGLCVNRLTGDPATEVLSGLEFVSDGLSNCNVTVACTALDVDDPGSGYHFRLTATGACTVGDQNYSRVLQIEVYDEQAGEDD